MYELFFRFKWFGFSENYIGFRSPKGSVSRFASTYSRSYRAAFRVSISVSLKQSGHILRSSTSYMLAQPRFRTSRYGQHAFFQCCTCPLEQAPCQTTSNNIFEHLQERIEVPFVSLVFPFTCSEHNFCLTLLFFCMCLDRFPEMCAL